MTIANHNVRIGRTIYTRGEVITEELSDEKKAWLLRAGAITLVDDAPAKVGRATDDGADEKNAATEEAVEAEETEESEETVEAAEVPEIDVSDGIVDEEPKPAKKAGTKKTGKKGGKAVEG